MARVFAVFPCKVFATRSPFKGHGTRPECLRCMMLGQCQIHKDKFSEDVAERPEWLGLKKYLYTCTQGRS